MISKNSVTDYGASVIEEVPASDGDVTQVEEGNGLPTCLSMEKANIYTKQLRFDPDVNEKATEAEILWCFKLSTQHLSFNSCSDLNALFQQMFPDSQIASQFSLGKDKARYVINFGLAPYFKSELLNTIKKSEVFFLPILMKHTMRCRAKTSVTCMCVSLMNLRTKYHTDISDLRF